MWKELCILFPFLLSFLSNLLKPVVTAAGKSTRFSPAIQKKRKCWLLLKSQALNLSITLDPVTSSACYCLKNIATENNVQERPRKAEPHLHCHMPRLLSKSLAPSTNGSENCLQSAPWFWPWYISDMLLHINLQGPSGLQARPARCPKRESRTQWSRGW